jgi:hypothetical protein
MASDGEALPFISELNKISTIPFTPSKSLLFGLEE